MKSFLLAIAFAAALCAQNPTTVTDTIRDARGRLVNGQLMVDWEPFVSADGIPIGGGRAFIPVVKGTFSAQFLPTDTGSPAGRTYQVTYAIKGGYRRNAEDWHICTTYSSLSIAQAVSNTCPGGSGVPPPLSWSTLTSSSWSTLTSSSWAALTN